MISLDEIQEYRQLFVNIKSSKGELMLSGDVNDELEEWTMLMFNIIKYGFDHDDFVKFLEWGITAKHWDW